ncbi:DJ-1/PfpI family protein [Rhodococcus artemisiae]|uniref:DJ-1/PfpI family protein n=1 Tax=Rhodococcus artemisiae TaxID=714159 RepID=A0ABU7LEI7_9NOCA|nr:DJ-1/PfpI family protein [Rhodococcus artemisiae]MEE2059972.1 DJ-1/PfpI family protein [Rhodococcus artemisiae]
MNDFDAPRTVHLALYDTLADWEYGYAVAGINDPEFQKRPGHFTVATVGATRDPITTKGGLRIVPDLTLDEIRPSDSAMLILPGNEIWNTDGFTSFTDKARDFLDADAPVAAICGATGALAAAGLLDDRTHTSNAAEFLEEVGYAGGALYRDEPAVADRGLITASGVAPVHFARAIFERLDLYEPEVLDAWFALYADRNPVGFYTLMEQHQ